MIHFVKMVVAAICVTATILECTIEAKGFAGSILIQVWLFLEWMGNLSPYKLKTYDPVIKDMLPLLLQITLFVKAIMY